MSITNNIIISSLIIVFSLILIYYLIYKHKSVSIINEKLRIYLINLKINKDRLSYQQNQSKREGYKFTRFPAVNGKKITRSKLIKNNIIKNNNILKAGQLGCAISHLNLLSKIQKEKLEIVLILEDDVKIPNNFNSKLNNILDNLPPKWDIIFLGGCNIKGEKYNEHFIIPTRNKYLYNLCMHSYLVNNRSCKKIIDLLTPLSRPIDTQLRSKFKDLNVYYANPTIILQNKDIRSTRRDLDGIPQSKYWKVNHDKIQITD